MAFPVTDSTYHVRSDVSGKLGQKPTEPFILPPEYGPGSSGANPPVVIQVAAATTSKSPPSQVFNADFQLGWTDGSTAQITAGNQAATNVWSVDSGSRQSLKTNFDDMYQALEGLEDQGQLAPGMAFIIAQRVAEALPLALSETLLFRCNFTPFDPANGSAPHGYVDLLPGMRLRVEAASGLYFSPGNAFNGFVGSGTSYWGIQRRRSDQALLFDAFAGVINSYSASPSANGAWGLVDLQSAGSSRYYRLFYPPTQFAAWPGFAAATEMCTLVGVQCLADLDTATKAYTAGQPVPPSGKKPISCTYFRGRAILVPEIAIQLNSAMVWLPLGITARQLIETYTIPSFTSIASFTAIPNGSSTSASQLSFYRVWSPADINNTGSFFVKVQGLVDGAFPGGTDAWDMPLLKGDTVMFQYPA